LTFTPLPGSPPTLWWWIGILRFAIHPFIVKMHMYSPAIQSTSND
jgi:hypothetical protein